MTTFIDTRGLEPPQPFEHIMEALADLPPGGRLEVLLDRTPWPLFRVLERDGYTHQHETDENGSVRVQIVAPTADTPATRP